MHVAQISFFTDPRRREPEQLLLDWPSLVDVAECACRAAARVSVVQASHHTRHLLRNDVNYYFLPFGRGQRVGDLGGRFGHLLKNLAPDVLHIHGLHFTRDILSLSAAMPDVPIFLQDHAGRPPQPWRRAMWRRGFSVASGIAFCAREQARPFAAAGLIPDTATIYEIPESTSRFSPGDQGHARRILGVSGEPLILSVGHLDRNKDPLTVLDGISRAARALPTLRLYCCYGTAPLLKAVQRRVADDPLLSGKVHLMGRIPHGDIEQMMRAADVYISGSHREGSGYSLIEALACGLPPVVSDIPSFRSLTGAGSVGALWPKGDSQRLCDELLAALAKPRAQIRAAARRHFEIELSFDAVGRKLDAAYRELLARRPTQRASAGKRIGLLTDRA